MTTYSSWDERATYNGKHVLYASPPGFVHTSYNLLYYPQVGQRVPPPELWKSHREWFWPRLDNASTAYGQLCWSNASLVAAFSIQQVSSAECISIAAASSIQPREEAEGSLGRDTRVWVSINGGFGSSTTK